LVAIKQGKSGHTKTRIDNLESVLSDRKRFINDYELGGESLLQTAVDCADLEVVQTLLSYDADPNSFRAEEHGELDCLSEAFYLNGHRHRYEIAAALLKSGADANTLRTKADLPLLQICCFYGDFEFVKLLYECGTFKNTVDSYISPMVYAVRNTFHPEHTVQLMKLLIEHGESLVTKDPYHHTLLHALASSPVKDNRNVIKFLVENGVVDCKDDDGLYATQIAFRSCVNSDQRKAAGEFMVELQAQLELKHQKELSLDSLRLHA
jgi:hypothetical protein